MKLKVRSSNLKRKRLNGFRRKMKTKGGRKSLANARNISKRKSFRNTKKR